MGTSHSVLETNELIASKLGSVEFIVNKTASSFPAHVDRDELYGAACLGLVEAAQRFDPSKGFSFSTWAEYRIRGAVLDYARSQDRLSQVGRRDARELGLANDRLHRELGRPPSQQEVATELRWSVEKVQSVRSRVEQARPSNGVPDDVLANVIDGSASPEEYTEHQELLEMVRLGVGALCDQQRLVVTGLFVEGLSTKEVAVRCGISISRVAQVRNEALENLRVAITTHLDDDGCEDNEGNEDSNGCDDRDEGTVAGSSNTERVTKRQARQRKQVLKELRAARHARPERPQVPVRPSV